MTDNWYIIRVQWRPGEHEYFAIVSEQNNHLRATESLALMGEEDEDGNIDDVIEIDGGDWQFVDGPMSQSEMDAIMNLPRQEIDNLYIGNPQLNELILLG